MCALIRSFAGLLAVLLLLGVVAGTVDAQTVVVTPAPQVCYYPAPAVTSYYAAPVISYYAAPTVSYYAPPAVSYYAPPTVAYYAPPAAVVAPATTVTTYRYGLLPRRQVTVTTYGAPVLYYGR